MVKYNTNNNASNIVYEDFITFWSNRADKNGDYYDQIKYTENSIAFSDSNNFFYHGYLKFVARQSINEFNETILHILIDNKFVSRIKKNNEFVYEFEGYVNSTINFWDSGVYVTTFDYFSTDPYELSEQTKEVYCNIPEYNKDLLGELDINQDFKNSILDWYNPNNNISMEKMEIWNKNFIPPYPTAPDSFEAKIRGDFSVLNQPSGKQNIDFDGYSTFPILIHKNDIGKQNTIGPLVRQDGSEIYINLTII